MADPSTTVQNFTETENKIFAAKKASMYKGSIAVCVVYGVVAVVLILLLTLTESGKNMLTTELRTFVITLIVGIFLVIATISIMIYTATPTKLDTTLYDRDMCPDYWKLQKTEDAVLATMKPEDKILAANVCKRDSTVLTSRPNVDLAVWNSDTTLKSNIQSYNDRMRLSTTSGANVSIDCNSVYPTALGVLDEKQYPDYQNKMRCEIANKCGFAWSSVCP